MSEIPPDLFTVDRQGSTLILDLGPKAIDIATGLGARYHYQSIINLVNDDPDILGYVEINSHRFDDRDSLRALFTKTVDQLDEDKNHNYYLAGPLTIFKTAFSKIHTSLLEIRKLSVVGMEGDIGGEYLGRSLAADYRVATETTVFHFSNSLGIPASPALNLLLPRYIGQGRAMQVIHSGKAVDAQQALDLGMISEIVSTPTLQKRCKALVDEHAHIPTSVLNANRQMIFGGIANMKDAVKSYEIAFQVAINNLL